MYKTLLLLIGLMATVSAQNKQKALTALETLCNQTKGMDLGEDVAVGYHKISKDKVVVVSGTKETVQNNTYTNLNWQDISTYTFTPVKASAKICRVNIVFNSEIESTTSVETGGLGDAISGPTHEMRLYIPAAKQQEAKKYLDSIKAP